MSQQTPQAGTILWPIKVLAPLDVSFDIAPRSLAGPAAIDGASQVAASDAGLWTIGFGNINVRRRERVICFNAISALMDGRLGSILVPYCRGYQPVPDGAVAAGLYDPVPHGDDAPFGDGSLYQGQVIDVTLAEPIALRATTATIDIAHAGTIQPGQHFSIGERLYRLRKVDHVAEGQAQITFRPVAREAAEAGTRMEFDNPVCRVRLASDGEMNLDLAGRRFGNPTVRFVEDLR